MTAIKPITRLTHNYTVRYCGNCRKRVFIKNEKCPSCGVEIDWSEYKPKGATKQEASI